MGKVTINAILVVEGTTDVAFLSTFLDTKFITTNGSEISIKTLNSIKELAKNNEIIVLTDPDFPGKQIRQKIQDFVPGVKHAFVKKELSIKKHKVGVAECQKEEVLRALENYVTFSKKEVNRYSLAYFINKGYYGLLTKDFRNFVSEKLNFDPGNNKVFIDRLNMLDIAEKTMDDIVKEYLDGNKST